MIRNVTNINTAYRDYVTMLIRRYVHNCENNTTAEMLGFNAVHNVYVLLPNDAKDIIKMVFLPNNTIADNVFNFTVKTGKNDDEVWRVIKTFEKTVAQERGLI